MADPFTIISAATSIYSFTKQRKAAKQQAKAGEESVRLQKEAEKDKQKVTAINNRRKRVQLIREARKRRADLEQGAIYSGVGESTALAGTTGAVSSQVAGDVGYVGTVGLLSDRATNKMLAAGDQITKSNEYAATAQTYGNLFQLSGGFENLFKQGQSIFQSGFGGSPSVQQIAPTQSFNYTRV